VPGGGGGSGSLVTEATGGMKGFVLSEADGSTTSKGEGDLLLLGGPTEVSFSYFFSSGRSSC
jgi:hypothetical protein